MDSGSGVRQRITALAQALTLPFVERAGIRADSTASASTIDVIAGLEELVDFLAGEKSSRSVIGPINLRGDPPAAAGAPAADTAADLAEKHTLDEAQVIAASADARLPAAVVDALWRALGVLSEQRAPSLLPDPTGRSNDGSGVRKAPAEAPPFPRATLDQFQKVARRAGGD